MNKQLPKTASADIGEDRQGAPRFQDWSNFISFQPRLYFRPQTLAELKGFVALAAQGFIQPGSLRVLGGLHSCSDICISDTIIDTSDLPQTIEFSPDAEHVTVSANWHLHDFLAAIGERGKSISATGGTDHQTLAGILSTNTAPATPHHTIYELVEWIEYISLAPDGKTVIEERVGRGDVSFPAMIASLGAIGILTRLQLRLVDELYFTTIQKIRPLKEILSDLEHTSRHYDFWRIDWIPNTSVGLLWAATQVPAGDPELDPQGDYPDDQSENILKALFNVLDKVEAAGPFLDNTMRLVYDTLVLAYGEVKVSGPMRNMLPVDRRVPLRVAMAEWSFDPADLDDLLERCKAYFEKKGWPNLPIEIELTQTDNYFMSPWNWPGLEYVVKFNFMYLTDISTSISERGAILAHLKGLWDDLLQSGIRFKAHWGKLNFMDPEFVRKNFEYERFKPFVRPIFMNKYLLDRFPE